MKILDLSAGNRAIWFDKENPLAVFLDKRAECNPTFVCDTTKIPDAVGRDFNLVVFDPPHENFGANGHMSRRYGHSTRDQIRATISGTSREAHRVTSSGALMAFKWNDCGFHLDKALALLVPYWTPLFGHHMRNRGGPGAKSQTFWVMLMRADLSAE